MSDEELFDSYRKGHLESFEKLFERYRYPVYQLILKHTASQLEANEILQNIFLRVHTLRKRFNGKHQFSQWLFVVSLSEINRALHDSPLVTFSESMQTLELLTPKQTGQNTGFEDHLKDRVATLSDEEVQLLHMRFIDGLAFEEIAFELGVSRS